MLGVKRTTSLEPPTKVGQRPTMGKKTMSLSHLIFPHRSHPGAANKPMGVVRDIEDSRHTDSTVFSSLDFRGITTTSRSSSADNVLKETQAKRIFIREIHREQSSRSAYSYESPMILDQSLFHLGDDSSLSSAEDEADLAAGLSTLRESASEFKPKVHFSQVHIREHPIIVGDNPSVIKGVPLSIAWEHVSAFSMSVDKYESLRGDFRREMQAMKMEPRHRSNLLRQLGFSAREVMEGTKAANIVRGNRRSTRETLSAHRLHETAERFKRGVLNVVTLGNRKRKEREYLKKHVPSYPGSKTPGSSDIYHC